MKSTFRVIMGPCAIESMEHAMLMSRFVADLQRKLHIEGFDIELIYKSCFNKANRTSAQAFHGVGMGRGLEILQWVKDHTGLRVTSDIHTVEEAEATGEVVDIIQIPHSLSRYTFILQAAAATGKSISVKKGLFMAPEDVSKVIDKIRLTGNTEEIILVERGTSFGYNDVVVDMRTFKKWKRIVAPLGGGVSTCIDATHPALSSLYAPDLARAGVAAGADMVFIEVHDRPHEALCDGPCSIDNRCVESLVRELYILNRIVGGTK